MSALETTVRVNSERQTLILAGEPVPQRFTDGASARRTITLVATLVDDPKLIMQGSFEEFSPESTAVPRNDRSSAYGAATAYARTQQSSLGNARKAIIDTYA